jgi:hypothetical protein
VSATGEKVTEDQAAGSALAAFRAVPGMGSLAGFTVTVAAGMPPEALGLGIFGKAAIGQSNTSGIDGAISSE